MISVSRLCMEALCLPKRIISLLCRCFPLFCQTKLLGSSYPGDNNFLSLVRNILRRFVPVQCAQSQSVILWRNANFSAFQNQNSLFRFLCDTGVIVIWVDSLHNPCHRYTIKSTKERRKRRECLFPLISGQLHLEN